jgi:hypothetical protein
MANFAEMNAVWDAWVSPGNTPARATVEAKLASPDYTAAAAAARKLDVRTGQFISGALNCSGAVEMYREATRFHLDPICM